MALRGVWQLQKLVVNYCDWGGSSRGIRYSSSRRYELIDDTRRQVIAILFDLVCFDLVVSFDSGDPTLVCAE
jgi:hypothetical protein